MIQPTINTHIDCSKNSKSVFGTFSKQQQGALKVCCASFSVTIAKMVQCYQQFSINADCRMASDIIVTDIEEVMVFYFCLDAIIDDLSC